MGEQRLFHPMGRRVSTGLEVGMSGTPAAGIQETWPSSGGRAKATWWRAWRPSTGDQP